MYPGKSLVTGHGFSHAAKTPINSFGLQTLPGYTNPENRLALSDALGAILGAHLFLRQGWEATQLHAQPSSVPLTT
jgi:hypothetical protein